MTNSILITGGSGMIGRRLTESLLQKGCRVFHLGRSKRAGPVPSFIWNVRSGIIDKGAFEGIDTIVHLAGAGIADKRWSAARKREILESRTLSTALLVDHLSKTPHKVKSFVCASAIGYYGFGGPEQVFREETPAGNDFLSTVVARWEEEVDRINALGIRLVKIRIGIVLSNQGGALLQMSKPVRYFVGAPLGSGRQIISWIHIDDLCSIFLKTIGDESIRGAYNATAASVTNRDLTESIARKLHRKILLPPVPAFVMRTLLGELSEAVLNGSQISSEKISKAGFVFQFPDLESALHDLLTTPDEPRGGL